MMTATNPPSYLIWVNMENSTLIDPFTSMEGVLVLILSCFRLFVADSGHTTAVGRQGGLCRR
jgi:hypothetical protein